MAWPPYRWAYDLRQIPSPLTGQGSLKTAIMVIKRTLRILGRTGGSRGNTFLEVVIAMLLVAVMSGAVMSIAITARGGSSRALRRLVADQASRQISDTLKNYVTGSSSVTIIAGPGGGANAWSMTNTSGSNNITDSCDAGGGPNCYALQPGSHTITGYLPSWFKDSYNATLTYHVNYNQSGANTPQVNVTVTWDE